jgi:hypothetical protein
VPGFYWQHISYVVVWWFMAVLLLILPLFPQMRQRNYIALAAEQKAAEAAKGRSRKVKKVTTAKKVNKGRVK